MKLKHLIFSVIMLAGCGTQNQHEDRRTAPPPANPQQDDIDKLKEEVLQLLGTQSQISGFIASDFKTCPASGDTADPLINQVCKIALSVTSSYFVEFKGEMESANELLTNQLNAVNDNIVAVQAQQTVDEASITAISGQITAINTSITSLTTRMTSAESAISALQTLTNSINQTLNGAITMVDIGVELLSAGPLYETVDRRVDKTEIDAYVQAFGSDVNLGNNPIAATNGSSTVTVTSTSHGLAVGQVVFMQGLSSGAGLAAGDLTGQFVVASVPTSNTFTIVLRKAASSSGNLGGNAGLYYLVQGQAMARIWQTSDGADAAVRQTTGTKPYNFIIKSTGLICYDKTNASATFATITANGSNIVCK